MRRGPRFHRPASAGSGPLRRRPAPSHSNRELPGAERFRSLTAYRVQREWARYEGSPLRDLFRQLRTRFLVRHRPAGAGWTLEVGPGPGRFSPFIGSPGTRRVLLDLSRSMLEEARSKLGRRSEPGEGYVPIRGNGLRPPLREGRFDEVVLLGNAVGFAGPAALDLIETSARLLSAGGRLILETVSGPGERSRYLHRLPPGAIGRLFAAPLRGILPRVELEGFEPRPRSADAPKPFRRLTEEELVPVLTAQGLAIREIMAVAPALGHEPERLVPIRRVDGSWRHLLELEESLGRQPPHRALASALLVAAERPRGG